MSVNAILSTGQGHGQVTKGHYIQKSHCGHVIHVWYTARSAAMYFFANRLNWDSHVSFMRCVIHTMLRNVLSLSLNQSDFIWLFPPQIDKVWDGSAHSRNMVEGARGRVGNLKCRFILKQIVN